MKTTIAANNGGKVKFRTGIPTRSGWDYEVYEPRQGERLPTHVLVERDVDLWLRHPFPVRKRVKGIGPPNASTASCAAVIWCGFGCVTSPTARMCSHGQPSCRRRPSLEMAERTEC